MEKTEIKVTNATILNCIKAMAESQEQGVDLMDGVTAADVVAYVDRTIEQMEKKKVSAAAARAKKAKANDELKEQVLSFVTDEPQSRDEIFANFLDAEDISVQKVGARLTALVNDGAIVKEPVRVKNAEGKSVVKMSYKLA